MDGTLQTRGLGSVVGQLSDVAHPMVAPAARQREMGFWTKAVEMLPSSALPPPLTKTSKSLVALRPRYCKRYGRKGFGALLKWRGCVYENSDLHHGNG